MPVRRAEPERDDPIVLVTDDSDFGDFIRTLLAIELGWETVVLRSQREALVRVENLIPPLVIVDLDQHNTFWPSQDQPELGLRLANWGIPALWMSAGFGQSQFDWIAPDDFVAKPFDLDSLLNKVRSHLLPRNDPTPDGRG